MDQQRVALIQLIETINQQKGASDMDTETSDMLQGLVNINTIQEDQQQQYNEFTQHLIQQLKTDRKQVMSFAQKLLGSENSNPDFYRSYGLNTY